jgi:phosphoribulokinase
VGAAYAEVVDKENLTPNKSISPLLDEFVVIIRFTDISRVNKTMPHILAALERCFLIKLTIRYLRLFG